MHSLISPVASTTDSPRDGETERPPLPSDSEPGAVAEEHVPGVLLVEDEDAVRTLTARLLTREGYTMFVASTADEAIAIFSHRADEIDLLITDLVLPGLDGQQLADRLLERKPGLAVVYISGYPWEATTPAGGMPAGRAFLAKPYGAGELASVVRETLIGARRDDRTAVAARARETPR